MCVGSYLLRCMYKDMKRRIDIDTATYHLGLRQTHTLFYPFSALSLELTQYFRRQWRTTPNHAACTPDTRRTHISEQPGSNQEEPEIFHAGRNQSKKNYYLPAAHAGRCCTCHTRPFHQRSRCVFGRKPCQRQLRPAECLLWLLAQTIDPSLKANNVV